MIQKNILYWISTGEKKYYISTEFTQEEIYTTFLQRILATRRYLQERYCRRILGGYLYVQATLVLWLDRLVYMNYTLLNSTSQSHGKRLVKASDI